MNSATPILLSTSPQVPPPHTLLLHPQFPNTTSSSAYLRKTTCFGRCNWLWRETNLTGACYVIRRATAVFVVETSLLKQSPINQNVNCPSSHSWVAKRLYSF